jgi:hypothetical protein
MLFDGTALADHFAIGVDLLAARFGAVERLASCAQQLFSGCVVKDTLGCDGGPQALAGRPKRARRWIAHGVGTDNGEFGRLFVHAKNLLRKTLNFNKESSARRSLEATSFYFSLPPGFRPIVPPGQWETPVERGGSGRKPLTKEAVSSSAPGTRTAVAAQKR